MPSGERAHVTHLSIDIGSRFTDDDQNDQRVEEDSPSKDRQIGVEVREEDVVKHVACTRDVGPGREGNHKFGKRELKNLESKLLNEKRTGKYPHECA